MPPSFSINVVSAESASYTATTEHVYELSKVNFLQLDLLNIGSYGAGFSTLTLSVANGTKSLVTKTFTTLSAAQTYFTDDPVIQIQPQTGPVDLSMSFKVTGTKVGGAGISYLWAEAPTAPSGAAKLAGNVRILQPDRGPELMQRLAAINFNLSSPGIARPLSRASPGVVTHPMFEDLRTSAPFGATRALIRRR